MKIISKQQNCIAPDFHIYRPRTFQIVGSRSSARVGIDHYRSKCSDRSKYRQELLCLIQDHRFFGRVWSGLRYDQLDMHFRRKKVGLLDYQSDHCSSDATINKDFQSPVSGCYILQKTGVIETPYIHNFDIILETSLFKGSSIKTIAHIPLRSEVEIPNSVTQISLSFPQFLTSQPPFCVWLSECHNSYYLYW